MRPVCTDSGRCRPWERLCPWPPSKGVGLVKEGPRPIPGAAGIFRGGYQYEAWSVSDSDARFTLIVARRTAKCLFDPAGRAYAIRVDDRGEWVSRGSHSMAPIFRAHRPVVCAYAPRAFPWPKNEAPRAE